MKGFVTMLEPCVPTGAKSTARNLQLKEGVSRVGGEEWVEEKGVGRGIS